VRPDETSLTYAGDEVGTLVSTSVDRELSKSLRRSVAPAATESLTIACTRRAASRQSADRGHLAALGVAHGQVIARSLKTRRSRQRCERRRCGVPSSCRSVLGA